MQPGLLFYAPLLQAFFQHLVYCFTADALSLGQAVEHRPLFL